MLSSDSDGGARLTSDRGSNSEDSASSGSHGSVSLSPSCRSLLHGGIQQARRRHQLRRVGCDGTLGGKTRRLLTHDSSPLGRVTAATTHRRQRLPLASTN
ncbi:hypothetical protein AAHE18_17G121800 [Arachis hypogaea]